MTEDSDTKIVWAKCRAKRDVPLTRPCEGNHARIVRTEDTSLLIGDQKLAGGGQTTVFECTTCKGRWYTRV